MEKAQAFPLLIRFRNNFMSNEKDKCWFCYLVRCADNSLYAGVTTEISRREQEHNSDKKGAKYTRVRQPVKMVYFEPHEDRSSACKAEAALKKLTKKNKEALVSRFSETKP